jgi:hypothetical protein
MSKQTLLDHFSALKDPRQAWKVIYPLPEVLLIVLCGTMAGVDLHFNLGLGAFEPIFGTSIETFAGRVSIEMPLFLPSSFRRTRFPFPGLASRTRCPRL